MSKKKHNWAKEKPHHVDTGIITTRRYAEKHPGKVEWVKDKKNNMTEFRHEPDGRVTRLGRCECNYPLYRKDLTNHRYEILVRNYGKVQTLVMETRGYYKVYCPICGMGHTVLDL